MKRRIPHGGLNRCTAVALNAIRLHFGLTPIQECDVPVDGAGLLSSITRIGLTYRIDWDAEGKTVRAFAKSHQEGAWYLAVTGHAMALINGELTDTSRRGKDGRRIIVAARVYNRRENPMKNFRPPFHIDFHSERGEVSIYVTDRDDNEVWYADTDTVNELVEDGFLDTRGFIMGRNARPDVLERSVISYLRSVGVIPDLSEKPSRHASLPTTVYDDARELYEEKTRREQRALDRANRGEMDDYEENPCGRYCNPIDLMPLSITYDGCMFRRVDGSQNMVMFARRFGNTESQKVEGIHYFDGATNYRGTAYRDSKSGTINFISLIDGNGETRFYEPTRTINPRRNPGDVHIDIHSHNTRGSHVRAKNPDRKLWVIQWFNEDHPVEPMWMERTSFEGTHDEAMETLDALQKKQPHIEFRLAEDRLRSRRENPIIEIGDRRSNPTQTDVDRWIDSYRASMQKRVDGVSAKTHYIVKIVTKDGQDAWLRVGKGTKFDTDPAKARVYRNGDKANEAATKVANWLKKKQPAKWKKIASISAEAKK